MLIKNIFYRELVAQSAKILTILLLILPLLELFRLIAQPGSDSIPKITILTLMLFGTLSSFHSILTIATFLAITIVLNRYSKESELVVWLASGVSPFYWWKQTAIFMLPIMCICGCCSLFITPWAVRQSKQYVLYLTKQAADSLISAGTFNEFAGHSDVYYIEHFSLKDGFAQNIFTQYTEESGALYSITARAGRIINESGIIQLTLTDGMRTQLTSLDGTLTTIKFASFNAILKQSYDPLRDHIQANAKSYSTADLWRLYDDPYNRAALSWRIAVMLMSFVMGVISVPLSMQFGRKQHNLVLIIPPIIYGSYQNIILAIDVRISNGSIYSTFSTLPVHIGFIILSLGLVYMKAHHKPIKKCWQHCTRQFHY